MLVSAPFRAFFARFGPSSRAEAVDVLRCAHCGSRRELLAVVMKADAVAAILTHLGLDTDDAGPRPPPSQLDLI